MPGRDGAVSAFVERRGSLWVEQVPLSRIARDVGTPTYVYSAAALRRHFGGFTEAFAGSPHLLCYSVKACSNLALLHLFHKLGGGFDVVSGGELGRVLAAGGLPSRTVYSGVGKTRDEMAAALRAGILMFNVESAEELEALDAVGRALGRRAPFAIRVNPHVDARTHRSIATGLRTSKFGVALSEARALYARSRRMRGVRACGVDCHIGSQLLDTAPVRAALVKVCALYRQLLAEGHALELLDVGGGLGITYREERPPSPEEYGEVVVQAVRRTGARLILEPGRVLAGPAGLLLTRVLYRKRTSARTFAVVDAGMNDLLRPALYGAYHEIRPVRRRRGRPEELDVVGPVCESSDVLGAGRRMVLPARGALLAVLSAGAYGMSMASTYNSRPRPAEVLVDGRQYRVVRRRDAPADLWRGERVWA